MVHTLRLVVKLRIQMLVDTVSEDLVALTTVQTLLLLLMMMMMMMMMMILLLLLLWKLRHSEIHPKIPLLVHVLVREDRSFGARQGRKILVLVFRAARTVSKRITQRSPIERYIYMRNIDVFAHVYHTFTNYLLQALNGTLVH